MSAATPEKTIHDAREHVKGAHDALREIGAAIGTEINGDEDRYRKAFLDLMVWHDLIARDIEALAAAVAKPDAAKSTTAH